MKRSKRTVKARYWNGKTFRLGFGFGGTTGMRRGLGQIEGVVGEVLMAEAIFTGSKYSKTVAVKAKVCFL